MLIRLSIINFSSSVNLFGKTRLPSVTYDPEGNAISVQESESSVESATDSSGEETEKQKKNRLRIEKLLAKRVKKDQYPNYPSDAPPIELEPDSP